MNINYSIVWSVVASTAFLRSSTAYASEDFVTSRISFTVQRCCLGSSFAAAVPPPGTKRSTLGSRGAA